MKNHRLVGVLLVILFVGCSTTRTSPKAWNAVEEGMSRMEVVGNIGQPASRSPAGEIWLGDGWELRIAYDQGDRATNVVRRLELK